MAEGPEGVDHDEPPREEQARLRRQGWRLGWVWAVPIGAAVVVLWLGWHTLAERGPTITISFKAADGLQAGQTHVQHRNVDVGVVESLDLTPDMSRVIVRARMSRAAAAHLTEFTRFAIIAPRVSAGGISGLSTLVSGTYIEMYPGQPGRPQRAFMGLDEPPVLPPDTPGRSFVLQSDDLGSLTRGSPISFRGLTVGEVEDYALTKDQRGVTVTAFVRAPYDRLVNHETRFWNAGGVDFSVGAQGVRIRANSWQQLLAGGVAFETPEDSLMQPPSPAGSIYRLYDNRRMALRAPVGPALIYIADFAGNQRGVDKGTGVELSGYDVGEVREAQLRYDTDKHILVTRVTFAIDPARVAIANMPTPAGLDEHDAVSSWLETLVGHGLRAQIMSLSLVTGFKVLGLEMVPGAPQARLEPVGDALKMPTSAGGDFTEVLQSLRNVLQNIDRATAGPELGHALQSLDATLTRLDTMTREMEPDVKSLITSLRDTADSAQSTLNTLQSLMGNAAPAGSDLPRLMRELTEAARSVRGLADYLDRHPEALLRGRKGEQP